MIESWQLMAQYGIIGAMLLLSVLGLGLAFAMPGMDRWSKRFFVCFFVILALTVGGSYAEAIAYDNPVMNLVEKTGAYLASLFPVTLMFMLTVYLVHRCGENYRKSVLLLATVALWAIYFVMLGIAQFTTVFYYYTPDGRFNLGPWYPLSIAPVLAMLVINIVGVVRRRDKLSRRFYYTFLLFLVPMTIAIIVHLFVSAFLLINAGVVIAALAMFVVVVSEQIEQYMQLQRETARQRASIAVLQMRPHFIHNTMTSIYYLCDQDPKAAQQVTMDFNTYLRKNFTAIAKDEIIPFSEELEHTRAYLAVEQAQFANKLVVEYDTPHTQFHVPPLTLQPLAENAVKHGMNPKTIPLRVLIRTRKTDAGSQIIVEDNGPGFDHAVVDDPHTTLNNIRQRLELMCDGMLDFASREGGGTVVKVTIPR